MFCLSLHHNGANSYLFVNGKEIHKFQSKDSEIVATPYVWETFQKTGLNGYVFDFSVDYNAIPTVGIPQIHQYLMIKKDMM